MRLSELLLVDFDIEMSNTRRTLARLPTDRSAWAPHTRSMALGRLAMHCATLPLFGLYIFEDDGMDMAAPTRPQASFAMVSTEDCVRQFDENAAVCRAAIEGCRDEKLEELWRFSYGEHLISELSRFATFRRLCFNHLVHHTAQLGVYLRLQEIPVPALYGPSADEPWVPAT